MYGAQGAYGGGYGRVNYGGGMGMMLPMGGMTMGGVFGGTYMFSGGAPQFQTRMEGLTDGELAQAKDATINIQGSMIKEMDICCLICTIIWGSLLILPIFFMCCDWWKAMAWPLYSL